MKKTIIFLTSTYPFGNGEEFIESEIPYWADHDINLVIMPMSCQGKARSYPSNVTIDKSLQEKISPFLKIKGLIDAISSPYLLNEIMSLKKSNKLTLRKCVKAIKVLGISFSLASILNKKNKTYMADTIYSYWNDRQAFAACILKEQGLVNNIFTRCHRFDIYEDNTKSKYAPLKRAFKNSFDKWFVICDSAKDYLIENYQVDSQRIEVARLGVSIPSERSSLSSDESLNILSVSNCSKVKQVHNIILALQAFSVLHPNKLVHWTHIGNGPLLEELKILSEKSFKNSHVKFIFLGHISNSEVKEYYQKNIIDCFINTSSSEGVPVSIMEAMSYGVPAIAPDVGGISELLEPQSCFLLADVPSIENIVQGIEFMSIESSKLLNRELCHSKIAREYSAEINFTKFTEAIING